jgi:hypothetical protein
MHQQSLDHSYSKRDTSLTKLKISQSVMILVVRLGQLTDIEGSKMREGRYGLAQYWRDEDTKEYAKELKSHPRCYF